jgi:methylglutaconyl-CoA hydratase
LIEYTTTAGIARITLKRPEKRNALNAELIAALQDAFERAGADPAVRVIVLRGAGKDFCAGLDLRSMGGGADAMEHFASARTLVQLYWTMRRTPQPIIAAVHGRAIGGGAGLATASDLIVATHTAEFRYPEVNLGFVAAIVMAMLRRVVGEKRTFEIVALADAVSAADGHAMGLVNRVWAEADFEARLDGFAAEVAGKSASALALTKDLLYHIDGMTLESALHAGLYGNALARMTPDARKGFDQFAGKS